MTLATLLRRLADWLDPPRREPSWSQLELIAQPDLEAVDHVLDRWRREGVPSGTIDWVRRVETDRRLREGLAVNSWGGVG